MSLFHVPSAFADKGVTAPMPVITTRLLFVMFLEKNPARFKLGKIILKVSYEGHNFLPLTTYQ